MKFKKIIAIILVVGATLGSFVGCGLATSQENGGKDVAVTSNQNKEYKKPKYIFTFIGDGMASVQLNSARVFLGSKESKKIKTGKLTVDSFPIVGSMTTQDSTSFAPDSASTATAMSSGYKTHSGVIGLKDDKESKEESITELLKKEGKKIGIVSSVSIDHATPAAFYAHTPSRGNMYDIALQLADSNFDYFAGGSLAQSKGKDNNEKDAFGIIKEKGYTITENKEDFNSLNENSGKIYAISDELQDSNAMAYNIDKKEDSLGLDDFVKKGIQVLDNDNGFFMMVEGGKIDWAGHANDAMTNIKETLALDEAIKVAFDFYKEHPDETLIIVTGDHETGGMTIGQATTGYDTAFNILDNQKMSYVEFDELLNKEKEKNKNLTLKDVLPIIKEKFGLIAKSDKDSNKKEMENLVLTDYEYKKLENAFKETIKSEEERNKVKDDEEQVFLYGGYEPLTVTLTHIMNNKAGIGWTSYSHTGVPVPVYAIGEGSSEFTGFYDNTDIYNKLVKISGIK
ncbi:alkaline phosphatase [uncultured Clostridium sp.]|uniref:alkaline phosphatase n=1 Tax=uncultured Clostridium sp. TaxID=59620 RepID=UPI0026081A7D|nr:alkaline phosphatase [uncultured Clostridium sp.]